MSVAEDKVMAMHVRHAIAKSQLDISELTITCSKGVIQIYGKVKQPRNFTGHLNLRKELDQLLTLARNARGVKDVIGDHVIIIS